MLQKTIEPYGEDYIQLRADEGKVLVHYPTMRTYREAIIRKDDIGDWGEIDG